MLQRTVPRQARRTPPRAPESDNGVLCFLRSSLASVSRWLAVRRSVLALCCAFTLSGCALFLPEGLLFEAIEKALDCRNKLAAARRGQSADIQATGISLDAARATLLQRPWYRVDLAFTSIPPQDVSEWLALTTSVVEQGKQLPQLGSELKLRGVVEGRPFTIQLRMDCRSERRLDVEGAPFDSVDQLLGLSQRLMRARPIHDFDLRGSLGTRRLHIERDPDKPSVTLGPSAMTFSDAYERLLVEARRAQVAEPPLPIGTTVSLNQSVIEGPELLELLRLGDDLPSGSRVTVEGFVESGAAFRVRLEKDRRGGLTLRLKGL